ncbi:E-selectin-like [Sycon ciliatum]|uniref:E-selectin-like n=1 Tax=Sycon ciliatum TaxID=27933 RepID=UPI0031F66887
MTDGSWSSITPRCNEIKCPARRPLSSGKTVEIFPGIVFFACYAGFQLVGTSASRCMANGSWSTSIPQCNPIQCFPFASPKNGTLVGSSQAVFGITEFACNEGYALKGQRSTICKEDGTWSSNAPLCEAIQCFPFASPKNGTLVGSSRGVFGITEFACNEGYALKGQRSSVCKEDGTWSSNAPSCEAIRCSQLAPPKNGTVVRSSLVLFGIIEFACNDGYALKGQRAAICKEDETWSSKTPMCEEVIQCPKIGEPANGIIVRSSHVFLGVTEFACDEGYSLVGNSSSVCMSNGNWSSNAPKCQDIQCSELAEPENGIIGRTSHAVYGVTVFACNEGYSLLGISTSVCKSDGKWSSETPTCTGIGDVTVNGTPDANSGTPQKMFEPYLVGAAAGIVVGFATAVAMFVVWMRVKTERTLKIIKESTNPFPRPAAVELIDNSAYGTMDVPAGQNECVYEHVSELS